MGRNQLSSRLIALAILLTLFPWLVGCAETRNGMSVGGKVTFQGQPITNGTVSFFPTSGRAVNLAISTEGTYSGQLPVGNYRVAINVSVNLPDGWKEGDPVPPPPIMLPPQYTSRARTPLAATVTDPQTSGIDFSLE